MGVQLKEVKATELLGPGFLPSAVRGDSDSRPARKHDCRRMVSYHMYSLTVWHPEHENFALDFLIF
jgi:hypothetical protein